MAAYSGAAEHTDDEEIQHEPGDDGEQNYENEPISLVQEMDGGGAYGGTNGHHQRVPDLSPNIKVVFPQKKTYRAVYTSHGKNKTTFFMKTSRTDDKLNSEILKVARKHDPEPALLNYLWGQRANLQGWILAPEIMYECCGHDKNKRYHCWITNRCIPLDEFAEATNVDKEKCVLAACLCMAKAATVNLLLSDCHFFNFGVVISDTMERHQVVIIDPGSRCISADVIKKSAVNECMRSLWWWAEKEIAAPFKFVRELWLQMHELQDAVDLLEAVWRESPLLTTVKIQTREIDAELRFKRTNAVQAFMASPHEKIIALIGASACNGGWNQEMSANCFKTGRAMQALLRRDEADVLVELYERLTVDTRAKEGRLRSPKEIKEILEFWWHLQWWREWWLQQQQREDTEAEILTQEEIAKVRAEWAWREMWYELTPKQKESSHLPSVYNAVLNNRSGWKLLANSIIKNKMPRVPDSTSLASVTEYVMAIGDFMEKLATWLAAFARSVAEEQQTEKHKRARLRSGLSPDRTHHDKDIPGKDEVLTRYL